MRLPIRVSMAWIAAFLFLVFGVQAVQAQDDPAASTGSEANPVLNIAHFAPFADDVLDTAVTIRVNGTDVFTDVMYGSIFTGTNVLPPATYLVELVDAKETVIVSATLDIAAGKQYSVIAIGGANGYPVELRKLEDDTTAPPAGFGRLRIGHLAPFAQPLAATKVDICRDDTNTPVTGLTGLAYGDITVPAVVVPAGVYDLSIAAPGTSCAIRLLNLPSFILASGSIYDAYAIGLNDEIFPLRVRSKTGLTYLPRVSLAHFAPFVPISPTLQSTAVTVTVSGTVVITNLLYSTVTDYFSFAQGVYRAEVFAGASIVPAIAATITVSNSTDYTLTAIGDGIKQPLELLLLEDNNKQVIPQTHARVQLAHLASFSPVQALSAVDVCAALNTPPIIANLAYKDYVSLLLPFGVYRLFVSAPGINCSQAMLSPYPILLRPAGVVYVYAFGDKIAGLPPPLNQGNADVAVLTLPDVIARILYLPKVQVAPAAD